MSDKKKYGCSTGVAARSDNYGRNFAEAAENFITDYLNETASCGFVVYPVLVTDSDTGEKRLVNVRVVFDFEVTDVREVNNVTTPAT